MAIEPSRVEVAERIVAIQDRFAQSLEPATLARLQAEQRRLWDSEYPGRSFDAIQRDVWLFRSY